MKLYLVRHGDALPPEIDPERGLSPAGKSAVEHIAKAVAHQSPPLGAIWHSPKARAKQTAEIFRTHLEPHREMEELSYITPNDPIEKAVERIEAEEGDLMIVGHLPFMNRLTSYLVANDQDLSLVHFEGGTCVCLESFDGKWMINWICAKELG